MNWLQTITLITVLLTAATLFGDDASNQYNTAKTAFDARQYDSAKTGFETFLNRYSTHAQAPAARFYLAESLMFLRQYSLAEAQFSQLVAIGLNDQYARAALFRLAEIPYIQGQFDIAKPRLEDFINKLDRDVNLQFVLYYLGDIAMRSGASEAPLEAEHYFGTCVRMFPEGDKILESNLGLAWAKNKLGRTTEADSIYTQLMASNNPAVVEQATYQYGTALFDRGAFQDAINRLADFQRRYSTSLYYADSQRVVARCQGRLNNFDAALQTLAQISQPTPEDMLLKVRCLYGLNRMQEAKNVLEETKKVTGTTYRDEFALLESVFLTDQKNWQGAITLLESVLTPQYDAATQRMSIPYLSLPLVSGKKLSEENFFKACSMLAVAYANSRQTEKASALLTEMQGQASLSGNLNLTSICTDTATKLASVGTSPNRGNSGFASGGANQNGQQWSPTTGQSSGNRNQNQSILTTGTDLDKFWRADRLYQAKNYESTVLQLEQILTVFYNQSTVPPQYTIFYNNTGAGAMDERSFAKACSLLALSTAQLGDMAKANAILMTFASRIRPTDSVQKDLLQETSDQLTLLAKGTGNAGSAPLLSDVDQRRLLREANSFFRSQRYDQASAKLTALIAAHPADAVLTEALFTQAKSAYKLGREQEGSQILERITDEFPTSTEYPEVVWYLGMYYESGGDSFRAVEYFQTLADKFPNFKNIDGALYYLALDDMANGNGRKATTYLTRIYSTYRNGSYWSHAVWTMAYEAYKKKQYAQSETYIQEILRNSPDAAILDRVLYLKGELAQRRDDFPTAFLAFREVTTLCKDSPLTSLATENARIAATKAVNVN
ncbi:MAG: tetratricopeptide repeat protein [Planctomycetaceae bacterium]|jgi:TolA-binding protein|nr:tetratricopeptide repeat protein [Planctomycetaceae bacterium]